jgi:beta-glucosidase
MAKYKTVAVIGPNAASLAALEGNYNGIPRDPVMPVDALRAELTGVRVAYAQGAPYVDGIVVPVPRTMFRPAAGSNEEGLKAEYFAGGNMTGAPAMTRVDPQIDFDWSGVSPLPGNPANGFAVRWTGVLVPPAPGRYEFTVRIGHCRQCTGDHFSLAVDGKELASIGSAPAGSRTGPEHMSGMASTSDAGRGGPPHFAVDFADDKPHAIRIEMTRTQTTQGGGLSLDWSPPAGLLQRQAVDVANKADLVIAIVGLSPQLEGEEMPVHVEGFSGGDRTDIKLPAAQQQMLERVAATGKPMVVVLLNGSALAVNWAQEHANAILEAWYPGEAGGRAIADTLLGKNNPAGRLPVTFYTSLEELPPFTEYAMKNRTYRYFTGKTLYGFGYGLSYTKFTYSHVKMSTERVNAGDSLMVEVDVKNVGGREGDEVAELYLTPPHDANGGLSPNVQMQGFQRVHLAPGAVKHVVFTLTPRDLSEVDAQGVRSVQAGSYTVAVGGSQPKDPNAPEPAQTAGFSIVGSQELPR